MKNNNVQYVTEDEQANVDVHAMVDNRTHYIHNVIHTIFVAGATAHVMRRCTIGYRINHVDENGMIVTVADAVCNNNVRLTDNERVPDRNDSYNRSIGRSIVDQRLDINADEFTKRKSGNNLRRYTWRLPTFTTIPETGLEWHALEKTISLAVNAHNNLMQDENTHIFIEGSKIVNVGNNELADI